MYYISFNDTRDNIKNFTCTFFREQFVYYVYTFDCLIPFKLICNAHNMYILLLIDSHLHKMISFGYHNGELFPILVSQISLSLFLVIHILAYWLQYRNLKCPLYYACMSLCVCVDMFVPWGMKTVVEQCHQF